MNSKERAPFNGGKGLFPTKLDDIFFCELKQRMVSLNYCLKEFCLANGLLHYKDENCFHCAQGQSNREEFASGGYNPNPKKCATSTLKPQPVKPWKERRTRANLHRKAGLLFLFSSQPGMVHTYPSLMAIAKTAKYAKGPGMLVAMRAWQDQKILKFQSPGQGRKGRWIITWIKDPFDLYHEVATQLGLLKQHKSSEGGENG